MTKEQKEQIEKALPIIYRNGVPTHGEHEIIIDMLKGIKDNEITEKHGLEYDINRQWYKNIIQLINCEIMEKWAEYGYLLPKQ